MNSQRRCSWFIAVSFAERKCHSLHFEKLETNTFSVLVFIVCNIGKGTAIYICGLTQSATIMRGAYQAPSSVQYT